MPSSLPDNDSYYGVLVRAAGSPAQYKVCLVCGNIVEEDVEECTYCCAYRFVTDPDYVSNVALDQATHPRHAITDLDLYEGD